MNQLEDGSYVCDGSLLCRKKHKKIFEEIKRDVDALSELFPHSDVKTILEEDKKRLKKEKEREGNV